MSNQNLDFQSSYNDGQDDSKFIRKAKENPFVPVGIAGALVALGYSLFKFKSRGNQKLSLYLIHTRVAAQGAIVGALTVGCIYQIFQEFVWTDKNKK